MKIDAKKIPKNFCILPWIHSSIDPSGSVKPCCMFAPYDASMGNLENYDSLSQLFNNEDYKQLRRDLLIGDALPAGCTRCATEEAARGTSYRLNSNKSFNNHIENMNFDESGEAEFKQVYIDYRFTNKCNHKCMTCGPSYSSLHATEFKKKLDGAVPEYDKSMMKQFKINPVTGDFSPLLEINTNKMFAEFKTFYKTIEQIYFAGGEPLIADHHYEILDLFISTNQPIRISYNTNFSELNYKNQNVIEKWRLINGHVDLYCSIDGIDAHGEALREGFKTDVFGSNIKKLLDANLPNVSLNYNLTFGITNIYNLVDTVKWLEMQHLGKQPPKISFNPIHHGYQFSIAIMDDTEREEVYNKVKEQINLLAAENINNNGHHRADAIRDNVLSWVLGAPKFEAEAASNIAENSVGNNKNQHWKEHFPLMYSVLSKKLKKK